MDATWSITRRGFLSRLPIAVAGLVGVLAATETAGKTSRSRLLPMVGGRGRVNLDRVTLDTFSRCLGSRFEIHAEPGVIHEVDLIEAVGLPPRSGTPTRRDPFTLVFRGPWRGRLPQRTYTLRHAQLGTFSMFLVPIPIRPANGTGEADYEAIFS